MYKPKEYEHYWFITSKGEVCSKAYCGNPSDQARKELGNTFKTEQDALRFLKLVRQLFKERL